MKTVIIYLLIVLVMPCQVVLRIEPAILFAISYQVLHFESARYAYHLLLILESLVHWR